MSIAIAIKHLVKCGATPLQIQEFVEEYEAYTAAIQLASRERNKSYERERKRAYRESVPNVPVVPGTNGTKEIPPIPPKENNIINITNPEEGECEGEKPSPECPGDRYAQAKLNILWDEWFIEWYGVYPKHVGRGAARKAYFKRMKEGVSDKLLLAAAKKVRNSKTEYQFIPHPATWLNQERWLDEWEKPPSALILAGPWKEFKPEKEIVKPSEAERKEQITRLLKKSIDKDKEEKGE